VQGSSAIEARVASTAAVVNDPNVGPAVRCKRTFIELALSSVAINIEMDMSGASPNAATMF
jgi:hypothetical protein